MMKLKNLDFSNTLILSPSRSTKSGFSGKKLGVGRFSKIGVFVKETGNVICVTVTERGLYNQIILRFLSTYYCAESFLLFLKICYGKTEFSNHKTLLILYEEAICSDSENPLNIIEKIKQENTIQEKRKRQCHTIQY